jgi:hypothetical protein
MRLVVKKGGQKVSEFRFDRGPVYIGRHSHSQVLLPERTVSRQHAVIFAGQDGKWVVQDLDSANKTFLNEEPVEKAEIKTGDLLRITEFTIEVYIEDTVDTERTTHLEDTLTSATREPQIIARRVDVEYAPDISLPARRLKDFVEATEMICRANGPDELVGSLLTIAFKQFGAYRAWCAFRSEPMGPMTSHAGKRQDGQAVDLSEIRLHDKVNQAVEKSEFLLLPQVSEQGGASPFRSAMIAPLIDPDGCFGVLYIDNAMDHEPYSLSDLDYLMLLAIHTAAIVENF